MIKREEILNNYVKKKEKYFIKGNSISKDVLF